VGLVQICTDKTALLLHMAYFDTIPASLTKVKKGYVLSQHLFFTV
jgi:hypothetical protein